MESESTYRVQGSRVYGNGESYNVTNNITAQKLDKVQKNIIQIQLSLGILTEDIHQLKETLE